MGLRLTCLAVVVLTSGGLMSGCLSNSNPPAEAPEDAGLFGFDSSVPFDAAVPDSSLPDATVADVAVPDSATPDAGSDAGPLPVTLVVVNPTGAPESGVTVVFSDASGAVLTTAATSAEGTVSAVVPAGAQVTVLFGTAANPALLTIVAVEPGDKLTAIDVQSEAAFGEDLLITALPLLDGGTEGGTFSVNAGNCPPPYAGDFATLPANVSLAGGCEVGGKFPLLATLNDENDNPLFFAFQTGNSVAADGGLDDAGAQEISMANDTWLPLGSITLSATNVPNGTYSEFALDEVSGNVSYAPYQYLDFPSEDGGVEATFPLHPGYADFTQTEGAFQLPTQSAGGGCGQAYNAVATRSATLSASPPPFDLSTALPSLTNALVDYSDATRPSVTWSSAAPLTSIDGTIAVISWWTSESEVQGSWTFVVPPTATVIQAPALPPGSVAWTPTGATSFSYPAIIAVDATFLPGYSAFRATAASIAAAVGVSSCLSEGNVLSCIPPLPEDGTLQLSTCMEGD